MGGLGLAGSQDLRGCLGDFGFQFVEFLLDYILIVREVGFQPFERPGVVLSLKITLEFIKLLIAHLVSQTNADTHLQRLVDMLQEAVFLGVRQAAQADFRQ